MASRTAGATTPTRVRSRRGWIQGLRGHLLAHVQEGGDRELSRGAYADGLEKCIGCELCAWACPADAIYVEGGDNTPDDQRSPGERYASIYQINYARCIFCGLCIEACPTRSLTMSNEYELARDNRTDLIFTKEQLLAPLLPGMEQQPHAMRLGETEKDYYLGAMTNPGTSAGAEHNPSSSVKEETP